MQNLTHLQLIKISGQDAVNFLQGQLTNDVSALNTNWQLTAYCNPKGRVLALLHLFRHNDNLYAVLNKSVAEATLKRLKMYVMRSDVTIESVNTAQLLGCSSTNEFAELATLQSGQSIDTELSGHPVCALIMNQRALIIDWTNALDASSENHWQQSDIVEGIADVTSNTTEQFVPQMLNLDLIEGISFKKGCYTGQEIIARMHYLGKLKQRMFVCAVSGSDATLKPGDNIVTADDQQALTGTVVSAIEGSINILAVLRLTALKQSDLILADSGAVVTVLEAQPYTIPVS